MNLALSAPSSTSSSVSEFSDKNFSDNGMTASLDRLNTFLSSRTPLLQQLRSQYPTGCLLADLVQVHSDQFVVRATVQVEGQAIVTALASAATVEVAEDRARLRALDTLGLGSAGLGSAGSIASQSLTNSTISATLPIQSKVQDIAPELIIPPVTQGFELQNSETVAEKPRTATKRKSKATSTSQPVVTPTLELAIAEPSITKIDDVSEEEVEQVEALIEEDLVEKASMVTESEPEAIVTTEVAIEEKIAPEEVVVEPIRELVIEPIAESIPAPSVVLEPISEPIVEVEENFEISYESDHSYESEEVYEYTFEEEPALVSPPVVVDTPIVKAPVKAPVPTLDLSETIAQIGMEIDRIGWTKKQGSAYLQQEYGKRTRAELTEAELFSFLGYLKSLPAKLQPQLSQIPF